MLKKINWIFRHDGIFDFSYLRFNTVSVKSDRSGVEDKKVQSSGTYKFNFFNGL